MAVAQTIRSRPTYGTLTPVPGALHLLVADAEGGAALLDLVRIAPPCFLACAHVIYVPGAAAGSFYGDRLRGLGPHMIYEGPTIAAALPRLRQTLATARMGTRLYLAGTEGLIGEAMRLAIEAGMDHASIETEHRGSLARRVQCVHCKGITEAVTTQPAICSHCGLTLLVRDHYSRRIGAFQGVCIDAEEPGTVPATEALFP